MLLKLSTAIVGQEYGILLHSSITPKNIGHAVQQL